LTIR